jgi:hypothetical protein
VEGSFDETERDLTLATSSFTRHSTPLHGVHSTTEGHLGVYLLL